MKFQNISIHGSNAKHNKATTLNGQKLQRAITPTAFHLIGSKVNSIISSSVPINTVNIKALRQKLIRYLANEISMLF